MTDFYKFADFIVKKCHNYVKRTSFIPNKLYLGREDYHYLRDVCNTLADGGLTRYLRFDGDKTYFMDLEIKITRHKRYIRVV